MNRYEFEDLCGRAFIVQVCTNMAEEGLLAVDEQGHRGMLLCRADAAKLARVLLQYSHTGQVDLDDCQACGGSGVTVREETNRCSFCTAGKTTP